MCVGKVSCIQNIIKHDISILYFKHEVIEMKKNEQKFIINKEALDNHSFSISYLFLCWYEKYIKHE